MRRSRRVIFKIRSPFWQLLVADVCGNSGGDRGRIRQNVDIPNSDYGPSARSQLFVDPAIPRDVLTDAFLPMGLPNLFEFVRMTVPKDTVNKNRKLSATNHDVWRTWNIC
jgi:hypothetical protein